MSAPPEQSCIRILTHEDYHADQTGDPRPGLSASIAKILLAQSPWHARHAHPKLNPDYQPKQSDKFDLGSAAHLLILEGDAFADRIAVIDANDWRTNAAKEHKAASREAGLIPMLEKDWTRTLDMAEAVRRQIAGFEVDPPLLSDGKPEQAITWEEQGVLCRARIDWLRDDYLAIDDIKTTGRNANPADWSRTTLWSIGADIQAAFYRRAVKATTGINTDFRLIVAETEPPYAVSVVGLAPSAIELGERKMEKAIALWRDCLERDEWPGYINQVAYAEAPAWAEWDMADLERMSEAA